MQGPVGLAFMVFGRPMFHRIGARFDGEAMETILEAATGCSTTALFPENEEAAETASVMRLEPQPFIRHMVAARAVSSDGTCIVEFDARPVLERANSLTLTLLMHEWFLGNGPGCRRLMEMAGADTQALLSLAHRRNCDWVVRVDVQHVRRWIEDQRPALAGFLDPDMVGG